MQRLADKTAVITGGAGGIGKAATALFVEEGANVLIADLAEEGLEAAVQEIGGNRVSYCVADVTQAADNRKMIEVATERYGGVDILLANAGIEGDVKPIVEYDEEMFDKVISVNVKGVWLGIKSSIDAMKQRGGGSIVITSSVAGLRGAPNLAPYSTSKHAVIGLARSAAKELAGFNIRVNTVNPSPVETRMMRSIESGSAPGAEDAVHQRLSAAIPLGRYAEPIDIARVMLFLASDESAWVTGSVYAADGGNTA
ncbi:MAG: SDR family oxidoreductase [Gammaproteobacteria bacterium]|nr:SDR family oxidoreductase [Gammaproteobacteria bacterium]